MATGSVADPDAFIRLATLALATFLAPNACLIKICYIDGTLLRKSAALRLQIYRKSVRMIAEVAYNDRVRVLPQADR